MININKIPHKYFLGVIAALVVILLVVTVWQPSNFKFKDTTDYAARARQAQFERDEYNRLLSTIDVAQKDSEVALKKIATEDVVKEEVTNSFQINQKISVPDVADTELAISPRGGKEAVVDYLTKAGATIRGYNDRVALANQTVFTAIQDSSTVKQAITETDRTVLALKRMAVPQEAVSFHKAQIVALQQYNSFLKTAQNYNPVVTTEQLQPRGEGVSEPWPAVYRDYAIINNKAAVIDTEFKKFDQKYSLSDLPPQYIAHEPIVPANSHRFELIKEAHAILGFGDTTIVVGDIPALVLYGIKQGLLKAFSTFIVRAIDKLVGKIDKYFTITSQLYYSQELGKLYTKEYWKKFNVPQSDQNILQNFIPDYFCVPQNKEQLKKIFEAKSKQLLKYDIKTISLESENFYEAVAELGTAAQINPELYWSDYYSSFAQQSQQAAAEAATKEVTSPGVKSGRDLIKGTVDKTLSKILDVQEGSVTSALNLGNSNADNIIAILIAGIFENITTKFIFTAVSKVDRGGGLAVVEEQSLCLGTAKYKPVIPGPVDNSDAQAADDSQVQACRDMLRVYDSLPPEQKNTANEALVADCRARVAAADAAAAAAGQSGGRN